MKDTLKLYGAWTVIFFIILLFLAPLFAFWGYYFIGVISKVVLGDYLVNGINLLLKTDLTKESIPLIAGTLGWVAMFFREFKFNINNSEV